MASDGGHFSGWLLFNSEKEIQGPDNNFQDIGNTLLVHRKQILLLTIKTKTNEKTTQLSQ